jgi:hypothetical protein
MTEKLKLQPDEPLSVKVECHRAVHLAAVNGEVGADMDQEAKARMEIITHAPLDPEERDQKLLYVAGYLIRRLPDADSLGVPKRDESESLVPTGGFGCEERFHCGQILMLKVFGVWRVRASMRVRRAVFDGGSRSDAARLGNVTLRIARD